MEQRPPCTQEDSRVFIVFVGINGNLAHVEALSILIDISCVDQYKLLSVQDVLNNKHYLNSIYLLTLGGINRSVAEAREPTRCIAKAVRKLKTDKDQPLEKVLIYRFCIYEFAICLCSIDKGRFEITLHQLSTLLCRSPLAM